MSIASIRLSLLVIATFVLAGCASTRQVAESVVRANLVQEQAHNQLLLLNVVRAYERLPMHFTQVSSVRLPVGLGNPSFGLPIPFGADRTNLYTLSSSVSVAQSVETVVLNSQEFVRGVTSPVSPSLMLYYLDQGWPQQLILHIFVRAVEFYDDKRVLVKRVANYPENADEFRRFQTLMDGLRSCEIDGLQNVQHSFYTGASLIATANDLKAAAAAKAAGLVPIEFDDKGNQVEDGGTKVRFAEESRSLTLKLSDFPGTAKGGCRGLITPSDIRGPATNAQTLSLGGTKVPVIKALIAELSLRRDTSAAPGQVANTTARFILRSPEAMLNYLGELSRARLDGQFSDADSTPRKPSGEFPVIQFRAPRAVDDPSIKVSMFTLEEGSSRPHVLSVDYGAKTFSVPPSTSNNRSMHVLSLLAQIIALQNKGTELPTTTNVRVLP